MFTLIPTNQFKKDIKVVKKRSEKNAVLLIGFLNTLQENGVTGIDKASPAQTIGQL